MRGGTSKREDNVFWIIALDDAKRNADDKRGARFVSRFTKPSRNTQEEIPAYEWHIVSESSGQVSISHKQAQTLDVFRQLIEDGVTECAYIAQEMHVSPATVSRFAKKAMNDGWLKKVRREYVIVNAGNASAQTFSASNEADNEQATQRKNRRKSGDRRKRGARSKDAKK